MSGVVSQSSVLGRSELNENRLMRFKFKLRECNLLADQILALRVGYYSLSRFWQFFLLEFDCFGQSCVQIDGQNISLLTLSRHICGSDHNKDIVPQILF